MTDFEDVSTTTTPIYAPVSPDMPVHKLGALIPVSRAVMADVPGYEYLREDWNPFPYFVPFPRAERFASRMWLVRRRCRDAWDVLLHGLPEEEDW